MGIQSYLDFLADPFGGDGRLITDEPDLRVWHRYNADGSIDQCEVVNSDPILEDNARKRSDNLNKRWGDGQAIGSVPLSVYFASGLAEANREGDTKWIKRWWNDSSHSKFRSFEGKV